jgi:hypothetical protein
MRSEQRPQTVNRRSVQRSEWLIKQPQGTVLRQRKPGQGHPATLPLRQQPRWQIEPIGRQTELPQGRFRRASITPLSTQTGGKDKVLGGRQVIFQTDRMADLQQISRVNTALPMHASTVPAHLACHRPGQAGQDAQQTGLANPIGSPHPQRFPGSEREAQISEERALAAMLAKLVDMQARHQQAVKSSDHGTLSAQAHRTNE